MRFKIVIILVTNLVNTTVFYVKTGQKQSLTRSRQQPIELAEAVQPRQSSRVDARQALLQDDLAYLAQALQEEDLVFATFLLKDGVDTNQRLSGVPIVFSAKSVAALQLLKDHGADLRVVQAERNLLHEAARGQDDAAFDYLLENGPSPYLTAASGETLWHVLAARSLDKKSFQHRSGKLLSLGLSPYDKGGASSTPIECLEKRIRDTEKYIHHLSTPYHDHDPGLRAFHRCLLTDLQAQLAFMKQCPRGDR